jgi:hypothetical protein
MAGRDASLVADAFQTTRPLPDIPGLVFRHLRPPDDYPQMNAIANATRAATGDDFTTTDEQIRSFYDHPRDFVAMRDVAVVEVDGRIVGYVRGGIHQELAGARIYEVLPFLDPSVSPAELLPLILSAMEDHLRELAAMDPDGEKSLQTFGGDSAPEREAIILRSEYEAIRYKRALRPVAGLYGEHQRPPAVAPPRPRPRHDRRELSAPARPRHDGGGPRRRYRECLGGAPRL